jgi:RND family efflux transporter MFP subunit
MKKIIPILIVLLFVGLAGWRITQKITSEPKGPPARGKGGVVAVEVQPVRKETLLQVGRFTGTLHPRAQFVVSPKVSGRLEKLLVNFGDPVKPDQKIAVLDNDEYLLQVDQAKAELEVTEANLEESLSALEISRRELERVKTLRKKMIASESELDRAEAQFRAEAAKQKVARALVAQRTASLRASEVRLSYSQIRVSCEDGEGRSWVVGERFVDEGALLAPNQPIVSVLDIGTLTAVIHVIEKDYPKVRLGQRAVLDTDAYPEKTFSGKVVRTAPLLKETSRQARIEIEIPNPDSLLKPGMFVRIRIEFDRHENATVVPLGALVKRKGVEGLFLADPGGGTARFEPVTLGIVDGNSVEILLPDLSGWVVTLGQHLLEDGSRILLPPSFLEESEKKAIQGRRSEGEVQASSPKERP